MAEVNIPYVLRTPLGEIAFNGADGVVNYVPDPCFDFDTVGGQPYGWVTDTPAYFLSAGAAQQVVAGHQYAGQNSLQVVTTAAASQGSAVSLGILPAGTYTARVNVQGAAGGETLTVFAGQANATGAMSNFTATTAGVQATLTFTTDGAQACYVGVRTQSAAAQTFYIDAVTVVPGLIAGPYFDGTTYGSIWNGAPGQSTSTYYAVHGRPAAWTQKTIPWLTNVTGLDFADLRTYSENRPFRRGANRGRSLRGAAHPLVEGRILFDTAINRAALASRIRQAAYALVEKGDGTLLWLPPDSGGVWWSMGVGMDQRFDVTGGTDKTFQLPLFAKDPTVYSFVQHDVFSSYVSPSAGGGLMLPFTFPIMFTQASMGGSMTVTNAGYADTFAIFKIHGTISNPTIYNQTTGYHLRLNANNGLTVNDPDAVWVDMQQETITLNGSPAQDLTSKLEVATSEFFPLAPGPNVVVLTGDAPDPATARLEAIYHDAMV